MPAAIVYQDLTKKFGDISAVEDLTLEVQRGEVFGFLGPNGAGKSTTVKQATALLKPTRGTVIVEGYDVIKEPVAVRQITGLLPEDGADTHYDRLTARENLEYYGRLYGVEDTILQAQVKELLEFLELTSRQAESPGTFSTGMKQKLSIARALVHNPEVVFLDEPTSSLDPIMAAKVREFIDRVSVSQGQTFFVCTHILSEAEIMCDRVAFLSRGQLVEVGRPAELRRKFWVDRTYEMQVAGDPNAAVEIVRGTSLVKRVNLEQGRVVFLLEQAETRNPRILRALLEAHVDVIELRERVPSLEDVYFKVIGGR